MLNQMTQEVPKGICRSFKGHAVEGTPLNAARRGAEYGKDFRTITFQVSLEKHKEYRHKAADYGVTVADVCRLALDDDAMWRKAQKLKEKEEM